MNKDTPSLNELGQEMAWRNQTKWLIEMAYAEDLGPLGDTTTKALIAKDAVATTRIHAREPMVVSGVHLVHDIFLFHDDNLSIRLMVNEGEMLQAGDAIMEIQGSVASMLTAERTALNFLQHLSGIATLTRRYVQAIEGTGAMVLDTRKTTPGYRRLEKFAVACGGGQNHRLGLYDRIMVKDNHIAGCADVVGATEKVRAAYPGLEIEVEADTVKQVAEWIKARPDWILLDNMSLDELREGVALCEGICRTEASGGISLDTIRAVAETGVTAISVGALTHSAPAADVGLDWI